MSPISEMKRTQWNDNVQIYHLTIKLVWKEFSDCRYSSQHTKDSATTSDLLYGSVYLVWGTSGTWYQAKWSQLIHIIGSTAGILLQLSTLMSCSITVEDPGPFYSPANPKIGKVHPRIGDYMKNEYAFFMMIIFFWQSSRFYKIALQIKQKLQLITFYCLICYF